MDIIKIFDASFARALAREIEGHGFFDAFYTRFLAASPEVAEKFRHTDMHRQQAMLKKAFYHLVSLYASSHADHYLDQVAIRHGRHHLDIRPALYDLWLESLVATLWDYDRECSDEVELAWRLVMAPGIVYMKYHYERDKAVEHGESS